MQAILVVFAKVNVDVGKEAQLPHLNEVFPNRDIKAPSNLFGGAKNHAEEDILNQLDEHLKNKQLTSKDLVGKTV